MKLWSDEIDSYREEARNMLQFLPDIRPAETPSDPIERAEAMRSAMKALPAAPQSEMAEESAIQGPAGDIPVRIFRPVMG